MVVNVESKISDLTTFFYISSDAIESNFITENFFLKFEGAFREVIVIKTSERGERTARHSQGERDKGKRRDALRRPDEGTKSRRVFSVVLKRRVKCTGRETAKNAADPRSFWTPTTKGEVRKGLIIMGE